MEHGRGSHASPTLLKLQSCWCGFGTDGQLSQASPTPSPRRLVISAGADTMCPAQTPCEKTSPQVAPLPSLHEMVLFE